MDNGNGFSFASVILSYFLVGGGLFAGTLALGFLHTTNEVVGYLFLAAGAAVGGFIAARASRGSTILEPAIGAVAVIATIVGLAAGTGLGQLIWAVAQDQTIKFIALVGGTCAAGALVGAFVSEKVFGEATTSSLPWLIYTALSTFGACLLATLIAAGLFFQGRAETVDGLARMMLVGMAAGCLLAGLAVGASTRVRPLLASLVGGAIGVAGFFAMFGRTAAARSDSETIAGIAVLAAGGAVITLIGTLGGWAMFGKRNAG
jgi:hypothetical protein